MSRRRKGNKLLSKIMLISLVVHIIAIPVLARFGTFEKIRKQFVTNEVTILPPPLPELEKPVEQKAAKKPQVAKSKGPSPSKAQSRSDAPHPPVLASNAPPSGTGDSGPVVDPNGTGAAGVVPKDGGNTPLEKPPVVESKVDSKPVVKPIEKPEPKAVVKPDVKSVVDAPPVKPRIPVIVVAEPSFQPMPEVPEDLRAEALDKTCVVEISVAADGSVASVKVRATCGVSELDQIALNTARKWKFKPATKDGDAVPSTVRLHVQFKVD